MPEYWLGSNHQPMVSLPPGRILLSWNSSPKRTTVSPMPMTPPLASELDVTSGGTCTPFVAQPRISAPQYRWPRTRERLVRRLWQGIHVGCQKSNGGGD